MKAGLWLWKSREGYRRLLYLLGAPVVALAFTVGALLQPPWSDPESPSAGWRSWLYPLETNAWLRVASGTGAHSSEATAFTHMAVVERTVVLTLDSGGLLWSEDGGWTWRSSRLPGSGQALAVVLASERRAYALAQGGKLYETLDGGTSWRPAPMPEGAMGVQQVALGGDGSLWLASPGKVWRLAPMTAAWREKALRAVADEPQAQAGPPLPVRLSVSRDGRRAWVTWESGSVLVQDSGKVLELLTRSERDGARVSRLFREGESWWIRGTSVYRGSASKSEYLPGDKGRLPYSDIHFSENDEHGWLLTEDGRVYRTESGGTQWEPLQLHAGEPLLQIEMKDEEGWIRGAGTLWHTEDGGRSWHVQLARSRRLTTALLLEDGAELWAGTSTAALLRSLDGGESWSPQVRLDGEVLWLGAMDQGHLLALTRGGLWRSTDGGSSWGRALEGNFDFAHFDLDQGGIWLFDEQHVQHSKDRGESWEQLPGDTESLPLFKHQLLNESREVLTNYQGARAEAQVEQGVQAKARAPQLALRSFSQSQPPARVSVDLNGYPAQPLPAQVPDTNRLLQSLSDGAASSLGASGPELQLHALDARRAWVFGRGGLLFATEDGGATWKRVDIGTRANLAAMLASADGQRLWLFGDENTLLRSSDAGRTWQAARNQVSLPLWYFPSWGLVALAGWWGLRRMRTTARSELLETVANLLVSDSPIEHPHQDVMGITALAHGLSNFIRNERTQPPLTLAVTGEWGTGKSSVLNLLRNDLTRRGFRPVWFNAWHHQQEDNLLAALYASIIEQCVPPAPRTEGLAFRLRLLARRGGRGVLLLGGLLVVLSWALTFFLQNPKQAELVTTWVARVSEWVVGTEKGAQEVVEVLQSGGGAPRIEPKPSTPPPADALTAPTLISTVVSLLMLLRSLLKNLSAFGVDPARLMASVEGSVRLQDVRERVSFQSRFAEDFQDVTEALGPRRLVILIDDLDRCTPENVVKMLEAINFLVCSGKCFVVMAISRRVIEEYVALQLGEVAERLAQTAEPAAAAASGDDSAQEQVRQAKRLAYARQYLEKLINVELPVPPLTERHAARLAQEPGAELHGAAGRRAYDRTWTLVLGAMAMTLAAWLGWNTRVPEPGTHQGAERSRPSMDARQAPTPGSPSGTALVQPGAEGLDEQRLMEGWSLALQQAPEPAGLGGPATLAALVLLLLLVQGRFLFPKDVVVRDSRLFAESLDIWRPVILLGNRTPRAVKRFLNRVRFLAMCQRALEAQQPQALERLRGKGLLQSLIHWLRSLPDPQQEELPAQSKEHVLVALAALHAVIPGAVADAGLYQALQQRADTHGAVPIPPEVHEAWAQYSQCFGQAPPAAEELEGFVRLTGSVQVR